LQKANYAVVFSLVSTTRATKLKLKLTVTTFTKIASPKLIAIWKKSHYAYTENNVWCSKNATFHC